MDEQRLDELDRLEKDWENERRRLFRGFAWSSAAAIAIIVLFAGYLMMGSDDESARLAQQPSAVITQPDGSIVESPERSDRGPPAEAPINPAPPPAQSPAPENQDGAR